MTCIPKYVPKVGDIVESITDIENRFYKYTEGHKFIISECNKNPIILSDLSSNNVLKVRPWVFSTIFKLFTPIIRKESDENLCPRCGNIEPHGMDCSCPLTPCFMLKEKPKKKVTLEIWVNFYKDYYTIHSSKSIANNCAEFNRIKCVNFSLKHELEEDKYNV